MILAFACEDAAGYKDRSANASLSPTRLVKTSRFRLTQVPTDEVEEKNGKFFKKGTDIELKQIVAKMSKSLTNVAWPEADHSKAVENTVEVVFQVNGKVRAKASVAKDMDKAALEKMTGCYRV